MKRILTFSLIVEQDVEGWQDKVNGWQGVFPGVAGTVQADGYIGVAPVGAYEPNGYGMYVTTD